MADLTGDEPCTKCQLRLHDHDIAADLQGNDYLVCRGIELPLRQLLRQYEYVMKRRRRKVEAQP